MNQFTAPLWGDEGFSAILSMHSLPDIVKIIINDTSPPLWNIFEWIVFNTLGTQEIYIRLLAFTFYLITLFFVYKIASFFWNRNTGIIAALLTALNPFFFTYAFEGRMYSIMSAGVAGSMYFFSRIVFSEKVQKRHIFGYMIMTLWALYSHHFAMFAVITQSLCFIYCLIKRRKNTKIMFLGFLGVGLGYLPWLWPLYHQIKMVGGGFWLGKPKIIDLVALVFEYLAFGVKHLLALPALTMIGVTLLLRKWKDNLDKSLFLASWFLIPILLAFVISQVFQSIFFNRYLLYTIPAVMILVASNTRKLGLAVIAIMLILFTIIDFNYFTHPAKLPFPDLAAYVQDSKHEGDFIINWNSNGTHHLWETKYYGIDAPIYNPDNTSLPYFIGTALMTESDLISDLPKSAKRIGVVTSGSIDEIKLPGYTEESRKLFDRLKFIWYKKL